MTEETLLPCPFCGGEASFIKNAIDFSTVWGVMCTDDCGAWIDSCEENQADAAKVWNTRQAPPPGWRPIESDETVRDLTRCLVEWHQAFDTGRSEPLFNARDYSRRMVMDLVFPEPPAEGEG